MRAPQSTKRSPQNSKRSQRDRWVKPFLKLYWRQLALALLLGVATYAFASALMMTSGYLITGASVVETILLLHFPLILVRIFGVGKPVLQYLERLVSHDWVLRMTSSMRLKLYQVLERDAIFFRKSYQTGDILGLLAEDIGHIQNLYLRTAFPMAVAWVLYLIIVVLLGMLSVPLMLVLALILAVIIFLVPLVSVLVNGARQLRQKSLHNELYVELTDNILGVSDWVFARRGTEYLERHRRLQETVRAEDAAMHRFARRRDLLVQLLFAAVVSILLLWAGGTFGGGADDAGYWVAAFALGFFPLVDAFAPLSVAAVEGAAHRDSLQRLNKLPEEEGDAAAARVLAADAKISNLFASALADDVVPEGSATAPEAASGVDAASAADAAGVVDAAGTVDAADAAQLPSEPFDIKIEGLSFRYPSAPRTILSDLTLTVKHGEKLAILGRSGSGKSTLLSLIRGDLQPDQGMVSLGGVPSARLGDAVANYVGVVQQQTYVFNMTLRENVRIGTPEASEDAVLEALHRVGLDALLARLPEGLDTLVDEAGLRFSGGERHRIALARVLLQDVPVVLLDEPTVGLDPLTERALFDTLLEAFADKTLIMVTHHLQGAGSMDRVVFLEQGGIELQGSPDELARSSERYQRLLAFDCGFDAARPAFGVS